MAGAEGQQVGHASVLRNQAAGVRGQHPEGPPGGCLKGIWQGGSGGRLGGCLKGYLAGGTWRELTGLVPGQGWRPHPLRHRPACALPTATLPPPPPQMGRLGPGTLWLH